MLQRFTHATPLRFLAVILVITFAAEVGIMFLLPTILPGAIDKWTEASLDATLLVLILAPILWWSIVRPMRRFAVSGQEELLKLRTVFETSGEVIVLTAPDGTIRLVNPAFTQLYGYKAEEVVGLATPRILKSGTTPPEDYESLWKALLTKEAIKREFINKTKDGRFVSVETSINPVLDEHGAVAGFLSIQWDVTEPKRVQERLLESEARYHSLFSNLLNGFAECKMLFEDGRPVDFVHLDVNSAFEELTGLKDVVGRKVTEVVPGIRQSNPELFEIYGAVSLSGQPTRLEVYVEPLDTWLAISVYSTRKEHFDVVFENITERKRAEETLREAEEKYRSIVEQSLAGVAIFQENRLRYANPKLSKIFGYSVQELLALPAVLDLVVDEDRQSVAHTLLGHNQEGNEELRFDFQGTCNDGRTIDLEAYVTRTIFDGKPAAMGLVLDVTGQRLIEKQYRQAQKMEVVGQLAGGVAHDFNNLLTVILGYSELLLDELPENSHLLPSLAEVHLAGERAALLTKRLLAFSRKQVLQPVALDLNGVITGVEGMLRPLIGENIQLVFRLAPRLNVVKADAGQLEQIILNLVVNAKDAMPAGGTVTVETANVQRSEAFNETLHTVVPGEYVRLAITDTGTGMNAETLGHLFEPFFSTKALGKGTGLGLATVYGIVKQSGGYVFADSQLGQGSTFTVLFPRTSERLEPSRVSEDAGQLVVGSETILLVEDEAAVRHLARDVLTKCGYTVLEAGDGEAAIMLSDGFAGSIDLILTDIVMPKASGPTAVKHLRERRPTIKVMFMSGFASSSITIDASLPFLRKPFRPDQLARAVRTTLDSALPVRDAVQGK